MITRFIARNMVKSLMLALVAAAGLALAAEAVNADLNAALNKGELDWVLERDWGQNKTVAELTLVKDANGKGANGFKLSADFSAAGTYAAAVRNLEGEKAAAIKKVSFKFRTENVKTFTLRVVDATGQFLQRRPMTVTDGEWHEVVIDDESFAKNEHYKGANDGKIHQPIKSIAVSLTAKSSDDKKPVIEIFDVQAVLEK